MSSGTPYVAPWQTEWERYSTQLYDLGPGDDFHKELVIPDGQWWRIIFAQAELSAGNITPNAVISFMVVDTAGVRALWIASTQTLPGNSTGRFVFGVGLSAASVSSVTSQVWGTAALPDLLWPQGYTIELRTSIGQISTVNFTLARIGVEIYTESRPGVLQPTATATPTML